MQESSNISEKCEGLYNFSMGPLVMGNFQCQDILLRIVIGQGPAVLAAGVGCWVVTCFFSALSVYPVYPFPLRSLLERARHDCNIVDLAVKPQNKRILALIFLMVIHLTVMFSIFQIFGNSQAAIDV